MNNASNQSLVLVSRSEKMEEPKTIGLNIAAVNSMLRTTVNSELSNRK